MKAIVIITILIAISLMSYKGHGYWRKYRDSKKLKIDFGSISVQGFNPGYLMGSVPATVTTKIGNYSGSGFRINQISMDVYSGRGTLIASQKEPLAEPFVIGANRISDFDLGFTIPQVGIRALVKESGGPLEIAANYLANGTYGMDIHMKGFVTVEPFDIDIDIDERMTV